MKQDASSTIGFLLLTHSNPAQILRLTGRLNQLYDSPPIAVHHDFSQGELPLEKFSGNISFVRPSIKTSWGNFSLSHATGLALQHMLKRADCPNWLVLLSAADYPIKPAAKVFQDLKDGASDAYMDYSLIHKDALDTFRQQEYYLRYHSKHFHVPYPTKKPPFIYLRKLILPPPYSKPFIPFTESFRCYGGSQWFSLNKRAAEHVVHEIEFNAKTYRQYTKYIFAAEESYFHTMLVNNKSLKVQNTNYRYLDWSLKGSHPKTLGMEDFPQLISSSAHFARKFNAEDQKVLDAIDQAVDKM